VLTNQQKRRRNDRDQRDGDEDVSMEQEAPQEDPLKNASTLYVGNLYVFRSMPHALQAGYAHMTRSFYTTEEQVYGKIALLIITSVGLQGWLIRKGRTVQ
jgi:nuclear cap-binding protein subunit 2